jgi:hypothetical protein
MAINEEIDLQETRDLLSAQETSKHTNANTMCRERRLEGTHLACMPHKLLEEDGRSS